MPEGLTVSDVIAITGHRDYPDRGALFRGLDNLHAREYVFGGARGADSDALEYISKTQTLSGRTVVVPNRVIDQPLSSQAIIKRDATRVIELKNTGADRFMIRNRNMVDRSTHVRAFYDFRGHGGTFNTIKYTKSIGKPYDVWPMAQHNEAEIMAKTPKEFGIWFKSMRGFKVNLRALKRIILRYVKEVAGITMQVFLEDMGYAGVNTLEQAWYD